MEKVIIKGVADFNLDNIFDCGQCFRWEKQVDGSYTGVAMGKAINVDYNDSGEVVIKGTTQEDVDVNWRTYLDLDRDYGAIKKFLKQADPVIGKAISYGGGIRILKQEPWETVVSFIISQNNNIPRIKKCINSLAENFGTKVGTAQKGDFYALPGPEVLAKLTVEDLGVCKLGYRAKYLVSTAKQVMEDGIGKLQGLVSPDVSKEEAFNYVVGLTGIGPKVANCILLFAMGKYDSFPIDTWVKKVMHELYNIDEKDMKAMEKFAKDTFGEYGGMAQQYLFYYMKENS
ncbi:MAG: DNA glycosylase [Anaerovoracaceae bacterium]